MEKRKNIIITLVVILAFVLVVGLVYLFRNRISSHAATVTSTLTLSPNANSVTVNGTFNVNIVLNTASNATSMVQINKIHFDPTVLQVVDADPVATGVQIAKGNITNFESSLTNTVDNTVGTITYAVGTMSNDYTGNDVLAVINFKALTKTAAGSPVTFDFTSGDKTKTMVTDSSGNDILVSVGTGSYAVTNNITANIILALPGTTNYAASNATFAVCPTNSSVATSTNICGTSAVVYQNTAVSIDSTGKALINFAAPAAGSYDYKIKVNSYLVKEVKNTVLTNQMTLAFGTLKVGDFDADNTVTGADFIAFRTKYLTAGGVADFDRDGTVTGTDFIIFRQGYLVVGD